MRMQEILDVREFAIPEWSLVSKYTAEEFEAHRKGGTLIPYIRDLFDIYQVNKRVLNDYFTNKEIYISDNKYHNAIFFAINSLLETHDEHVVWSMYENGSLPKEEFPLQYVLPLSSTSSTRRKLKGLTIADFQDSGISFLRNIGDEKRNKIREISGRL